MGTYDNIIETIGKTPLVKLNRIAKGIEPTLYAKLEYFPRKEYFPLSTSKDPLIFRGSLYPGWHIGWANLSAM